MKKLLLLLILVWVVATTIFPKSVFPFQDTTLDDDERIDNLLSLMTIDEKLNNYGLKIHRLLYDYKSCECRL